MININQRFDSQHSDLIRLSQQNDCPSYVFIKLSNYSASNAHYYLKEGLLNKNLNIKSLEEVYIKGNDEIKKLVAFNPSITDKIVDQIINSNDTDIIFYLACNNGLNENNVIKIIDYAIKTKDNNLISNLIKNNRNALCYILKNKNELQNSFDSTYSLDEEINIRLSITSKSIVNDVYNNYLLDESNLIAISLNQNTPLKVLKDILVKSNNNKNIIEALSKNKNIDNEMIKTLLKIHNNEKIFSNILSNSNNLELEDIITSLKKYKNNEKIIDLTLSYLHKITNNIGTLYAFISKPIIELANLNIEKINYFLAFYSAFSNELSFLLLNNDSIKVKRKLATYTRNNDVLLFLGYTTKDLDTYVNVILNSDISDDNIFILLKSKLFKDVLLKNHKDKDEVYEKYKDFCYDDGFLRKNKTNNELKYKNIIVKRLNNYFNELPINSTTSLIKETDKFSIEENNIKLTSDEFELIDYLNEKQNLDYIIYGRYPQKLVTDNNKNTSLNILYDLKALKQTGKKYRIIGNNGNIYNYNEYIINNEKYIRYESKWIEVLPIKWKIDKENRCFKAINNFLFTDNIDKNIEDKYLNVIFKHDILEPYTISEEEKIIKESLKEKTKKNLAKFTIIDKKNKEEEKEKQVKERIKEVSKNILELKKSIELLEESKINLNDTLSKIKSSIKIPDELLIQKVNDHYEFSPEFIPLLKYIDLSFIDTKNLKLSGLDLSETNIHFNPQTIYNKDLSGTKLSDDNVSWVSFRDVNLENADIENEKDSYEIDYAIINENTKLPKKEKVKTL